MNSHKKNKETTHSECGAKLGGQLDSQLDKPRNGLHKCDDSTARKHRQSLFHSIRSLSGWTPRNYRHSFHAIGHNPSIRPGLLLCACVRRIMWTRVALNGKPSFFPAFSPSFLCAFCATLASATVVVRLQLVSASGSEALFYWSRFSRDGTLESLPTLRVNWNGALVGPEHRGGHSWRMPKHGLIACSIGWFIDCSGRFPFEWGVHRHKLNE